MKNLLYSCGIVAKREGLQKALEIIGHYLSFKEHTPVLLVGAGYNWDDSLYELYLTGFEVHHIRDITKFEIPYQYFRAFIEVNNIKAILISTNPEPEYEQLAQAAKDLGIPIVSWQHGGGGYFPLLLLERLEYRYSNYHLVFGEGVKDSYERFCKSIGRTDPPTFIPVGSATLDRLHRQYKRVEKDHKQTTATYITTHRNDSTEFDTYTEDQLLEVQSKILKGVWGNNLIIKVHPVFPQDIGHIKKLVPENTKMQTKIISEGRTITDLAKDSDLIIFDLVSTGILEAMVTTVPIWFCKGLQPLEPIVLELLRKRCYIMGEGYINTPLESNTEFLRHFGTDIETLDSAKKAILKLIEIIDI